MQMKNTKYFKFGYNNIIDIIILDIPESHILTKDSSLAPSELMVIFSISQCCLEHHMIRRLKKKNKVLQIF